MLRDKIKGTLSRIAGRLSYSLHNSNATSRQGTFNIYSGSQPVVLTPREHKRIPGMAGRYFL
jgi:hypothetical protein